MDSLGQSIAKLPPKTTPDVAKQTLQDPPRSQPSFDPPHNARKADASCKNVMHHACGFDSGQAEVESLGSVCETLMLDPHQV